MTSLPEPNDFDNEGKHGYDAKAVATENLYTREDDLDIESPENDSNNESITEFENKEVHGYDNSVSTPDTVYEQKDEDSKDYGGHRISRDQAEAYAIQLHKEMLQLRSRLSDHHDQMRSNITELNQDFKDLLDNAIDEYENGENLRELSDEYVPELKSLRDQAEESISYEIARNNRKRTPTHAIQELQYFKTRWQGVVENHDRGSTDYTWDHRGTSDTVLQALRHIEEDLQNLKKTYCGLENNIDMMDQIVYEFPEEVERRSEDFEIEWDDEEVREELGEALEDSNMDLSDLNEDVDPVKRLDESYLD